MLRGSDFEKTRLGSSGSRKVPIPTVAMLKKEFSVRVVVLYRQCRLQNR